jgi:hypothetical protein
MRKKINFVCPRCGHNVLIESGYADYTREVTGIRFDIDQHPRLYYEDEYYDHASEIFGCDLCGSEIPHIFGYTDLIKWLQDNGMIEGEPTKANTINKVEIG